MHLLRVGDTVRRPIYGRRRGVPEPVLLLAAGQRIESAEQLRQLRAEGLGIRTPAEAAYTVPSASVLPASQTLPARDDAALGRQSERTRRLHASIVGAGRELLQRLGSGAILSRAGNDLCRRNVARELADDPAAVVTMTYLKQCDDYTVEHGANVAILMVAIAHLLGHAEADLRLVALAGLVHDVGKQRLPPHLLDKPDNLDIEDHVELRRHPGYGFEILSKSPDCPPSVLSVVLEHHERQDGSGYPERRTGELLHPHSRIAAVADVFDDMTTNHVHRRRLPARQVLQMIYADRGRLFDDEAVAALVKLVGVYPVGTRVHLDTGESGVVVAPNVANTTRPVVEIDRDSRGVRLPCPYQVRLQENAQRIVRVGQE